MSHSHWPCLRCWQEGEKESDEAVCARLVRSRCFAAGRVATCVRCSRVKGASRVGRVPLVHVQRERPARCESERGARTRANPIAAKLYSFQYKRVVFLLARDAGACLRGAVASAGPPQQLDEGPKASAARRASSGSTTVLFSPQSDSQPQTSDRTLLAPGPMFHEQLKVVRNTTEPARKSAHDFRP